ncbi:MAG: Eco57I restriction-modification methylase domain-containing protein [Verrucomicrobiae bacterium]
MHDVLQTDLFPKSRLSLDALSVFSDAPAEDRGAVHTRPEVAEFVLDAVGWTESEPLESFRLLEPSAGEGDFLVPAVERLISRIQPDDLRIGSCIRAVEINLEALQICWERIEMLLLEHGWSTDAVQSLLDAWLLHDDFLSVPLESVFSHIVGNPPYIRLENLPKDLLKAYRARWRALFDRADLYVAFIEKSLELLRPDGRLGFICADRWMKNRYGGPLRDIVAQGFHLESYVDFTGCPAFFDEVDAYPAVTVIRKGKGNMTRTAFRPEIARETLVPLAKALASHAKHPQVTLLSGICHNDRPWSFNENGGMPIVRKLEADFPNLEAAGCKVGIGVATGADAVFIGSDEDLDVEPERKLPLVTTKDIRNGRVEWGGHFVLNPFESDGRLVDPADHPKFRAYIERHRDLIQKRNVAGRNPNSWFRTIDRIHAPLTKTPKLLIPDIKGSAHVVLEPGHYYPHHNLYFVTSESWDLRILQMLLSSRVAHAFIAAYSPRMRGNFLRFQAQYLRRIRIPRFEEMDKAMKKEVLAASRSSSQSAKDGVIQKLYNLSKSEWDQLDPAILTA